MKSVFMGTPDFSVGCLEVLNDASDIVGVFTQPDKPKGRGYELSPPPVKVRAEELGLKVYQPKSLRDGEALNILKSLQPDIIIVVAYGKFLPNEILSLPKYGCINVHASLLPRHRGASPIQWSIVSGDTETGVTTMLMDEGMDTGDMLITSKTPITDTDTAESLHDRLALLGAKTLKETLEKWIKGDIKPVKQPKNGVTYAPIIKKEMALLDFSKSFKEINCLVRGFYPWPCAYTFLGKKRLKVYSVKAAEGEGEAGSVIANNGKLIVACGDGAVEICELQLEGSKRMSASEMLRGRKIEIGEKLGI